MGCGMNIFFTDKSLGHLTIWTGDLVSNKIVIILMKFGTSFFIICLRAAGPIPDTPYNNSDSLRFVHSSGKKFVSSLFWI